MGKVIYPKYAERSRKMQIKRYGQNPRRSLSPEHVKEFEKQITQGVEDLLFEIRYEAECVVEDVEFNMFYTPYVGVPDWSPGEIKDLKKQVAAELLRRLKKAKLD
jgi:hypothetical protein